MFAWVINKIEFIDHKEDDNCPCDKCFLLIYTDAIRNKELIREGLEKDEMDEQC